MYRWADGRASCKAHSVNFSLRFCSESEASLIGDVIDRAFDLHDGIGSEEAFMEAAETALANGRASVWESAGNWLGLVAIDFPQVEAVWDGLARHSQWQVRWRVACCLYQFGIVEEQSNRLFARLRYDKSKKVREYAVSRYEHRPNPIDIEKVYDSADFDDRARRGEVKL